MTAAAPTATYRVQVRPGFGFDAVGEIVDYLALLGVSHVYLSPVLAAAPGSTHGYDVVDHTRLNDEAGGQPAFDRLADALAAAGMAAIADVVPNHMSVPNPVRLNRALWSVLRDGPSSRCARWFDVDWTVPSHALLMPVLGERIGEVLRRGELRVDAGGDEPVLRYHDREFPLRPGTAELPIEQLLDRQWYRLAWWRVADDELNYRRFFDVDTLAAIRVEDPEVFAATHALLLDLIRQGRLAGLRIDHPDGLADPRGYLARLAEATEGTWVVVEKILEGDETLPADWHCAGTTGYDALRQVGGLFCDPAGAAALSSLLAEITGEPGDFGSVVAAAKRQVVDESLYAEANRLTHLLVGICRRAIGLRDHTRRHLHEAVVELLVAFDRYRAYVVPGEDAPAESVATVDRAAALARARLGEEAAETLDLVRDLVLGLPAGLSAGQPVDERDAEERRDLVVRFQQTCGPVMAKGTEDTAFYRWHRLTALNEVGGDPDHLGVAPEAFHAFAARIQRDWPLTMTTLSTHDTKRSEDVRARLAVLAELPVEWAEAVRGWLDAASRHRCADGWPDHATAYLFWQTLVGIWDGPPACERLVRYLTKATREAKLHTSWTRPDPAFEAGCAGYVSGVLDDGPLLDSVSRFCAALAPATRVAVLGQKLVQLTMPGAPDVYQGTEVVDQSLVDPDNRRDVDFADRRARLARLDGGGRPRDLSDEKLLVTSRALRLRRDRRDAFAGAYQPLATSSGNAVAFARGGDVVTVATRLPVALERHGGWAEHTVTLPAGRWRDALSAAEHDGGSARLADVLAELPVALLAH